MYSATDKIGTKYMASKELKSTTKDKHLFLCPSCGQKVVLKAGDIKTPHFAHDQKVCDYFDYKGMSDWHLEWQSKFKKQQREVIVLKGGIKHIADVINSNGIVIEFQNSPIPYHKKEERDLFYEKLIWVVNAENFNVEFKNVHTGEYLKYLNELSNAKNEMRMLYDSIRDFEFHSLSAKALELDLVEEIDKIRQKHKDKIKAVSQKMPQCPEKIDSDDKKIVWKNKRQIWIESKTPVFLDFGGYLALLTSETTAKQISKESFISKYCI
jgi:competence CoiA-like predicted nuclease